jgi:hypothetical protein
MAPIENGPTEGRGDAKSATDHSESSSATEIHLLAGTLGRGSVAVATWLREEYIRHGRGRAWGGTYETGRLIEGPLGDLGEMRWRSLSSRQACQPPGRRSAGIGELPQGRSVS